MSKIIILLIFLSMSSFSNIENYGSKDRSKKLMVHLNFGYLDDINRTYLHDYGGQDLSQTLIPQQSFLLNLGVQLFFPIEEKFGISLGYNHALSDAKYHNSLSFEDDDYDVFSDYIFQISSFYLHLHYDITNSFQVYGAYYTFWPTFISETMDVTMQKGGDGNADFSVGINYFYLPEIIFFLQYDSFFFEQSLQGAGDYSFSDFSTSIIYAGLKYQLPFNF